jgi:mannose-1-phosphate guanylyltransferase/mannose-6-phosphate isomerase
MSRRIYPVILSGGSGTRLWPLSRDLFPKQLLPLIGDMSLLAQTARRVSGDRFGRPIIVCNNEHRFMVAEQLEAVGIQPEAIIIEPVARNTAPAIAAAAAFLGKRDPDGLMLVLPSDHIIRDEPAFTKAIAAAAQAAEAGWLTTFGITPTAPETGLGYIRSGETLPAVGGAFRIGRFPRSRSTMP